MTSSIIREKFLAFFEERGHKIYESSSLVPNDPTLLLTAAGMVQFKPFFLGLKKPDVKRAASIQKCARTTDIGLVGKTARHLTFFEMLGNFSFGDYYKKESIEYAWDFLTNHVHLEVEKLWATVFYEDEDAVKAWIEIGIDPDRIVRLGEKDNFWSAGPTGPCGPCSEILIDQGEEFGCNSPDCKVGCDCDRYLELWNLVFMQYDRDEAGDLHPLKVKGIDTGMGLERLASVLQGVRTNFDTDLLKPIIDKITILSKVPYGADAKSDASIRLIADHARATTFLISDGVFPSNEGRGYILRRLIRRAVRHGRLLGIEDKFLVRLAATAVETMSGRYPDLKGHEKYIFATIDEEETRFTKTLKQGITLLTGFIEEAKSKKTAILAGADVFKLYDTYGFPVELTTEMAEEEGLGIDEDSFNALMEDQRIKSGKGISHAADIDLNLSKLEQDIGATEFIGYFNYKEKAQIKAITIDGELTDSITDGQKGNIVLDKTVFYGTSGGQVGDTGVIQTNAGRFEVSNTEKTAFGLILHGGTLVKGKLSVGDPVTASVDEQERKAIMKNHTATHLLHWALRTKLGEHVKQAGSLVTDKRLRFDFTHNKPLSREFIKEVEVTVNNLIVDNLPVRAFTTSIEYAKESGVTALFGEKYGEFVRVIEVDDISKELCGGTHIAATGEIGSIKIVSEASIGSNLRRIEALTGMNAVNYVHDLQDSMLAVEETLSAKAETVPQRIVELVEKNKALEAELKKLKHSSIKEVSEELINNSEKIGDISFISGNLEKESVEELRRYMDLIRQKVKDAAVVLTATGNGKVHLIAGATKQAVEKGFQANQLIKIISPIIDGGGGGKPELAQAGGKRSSNINEVFNATREYIRELESK